MRYNNRERVEKRYVPPELNVISGGIVKAAFEVHTTFGPGLLESVYERCLARELELRGFSVQCQVPVPLVYADIDFDAGFRIDILVNDSVIVELKAVEALLPVHFAQVLTYLKLTDLRLALLIYFNVPLIRDGIKRIVL